ncbi:hypothetical protein QBC44DRAFT_372377 [Cladorrhinum sp. PSN332]|nr:hypothetical protein QBC44DRAFT_372377 [Cladorrhinum sp. PSN332]
MGLRLYYPGLYAIDPETGRTIRTDVREESQDQPANSPSEASNLPHSERAPPARLPSPESNQSPILRLWPVHMQQTPPSEADQALAAFDGPGDDMLHSWRQRFPDAAPFLSEFRQLHGPWYIEALANCQGADQLIQRLDPSETVNVIMVPLSGPPFSEESVVNYLGRVREIAPFINALGGGRSLPDAIEERLAVAAQRGITELFLIFISRDDLH